MTETVTLDGSIASRWMEFETVDSVSKGAKYFSCSLENTDDAITDTYEAFDASIISIDGTNVFNGRMEEIISTSPLRASGPKRSSLWNQKGFLK